MLEELLDKVFKKQEKQEEQQRKEILKQCITIKDCKIKVDTRSSFDNVRWLNKHGLLKYFKTPDNSVIVVYPTLFTSYLTLIKKCGIEEIYTESVKLYNLMGEINGNQKNNFGQRREMV